MRRPRLESVRVALAAPGLSRKGVLAGGAVATTVIGALVMYALRRQEGCEKVAWVSDVTYTWMSARYVLVETESGRKFVVPSLEHGKVIGHIVAGTPMTYVLGAKRVRGRRVARACD